MSIVIGSVGTIVLSLYFFHW